jgi:hypothetical protein
MTDFAVDVGDHGQLIAAFRQRIEQLDVSWETVEDIAGLQMGYLSKCLGTPPLKRASPFTIFLIASALGLRLSLTQDPAATEKLKGRWIKRNPRMIRSAVGTPKVIELTPDHMRRIGRMGGRARAALPNASEINRRAALTRWRRVRERAV